jgi:hypothetical protein
LPRSSSIAAANSLRTFNFYPLEARVLLSGDGLESDMWGDVDAELAASLKAEIFVEGKANEDRGLADSVAAASGQRPSRPPMDAIEPPASSDSTLDTSANEMIFGCDVGASAIDSHADLERGVGVIDTIVTLGGREPVDQRESQDPRAEQSTDAPLDLREQTNGTHLVGTVSQLWDDCDVHLRPAESNRFVISPGAAAGVISVAYVLWSIRRGSYEQVPPIHAHRDGCKEPTGLRIRRRRSDSASQDKVESMFS